MNVSLVENQINLILYANMRKKCILLLKTFYSAHLILFGRRVKIFFILMDSIVYLFHMLN